MKLREANFVEEVGAFPSQVLRWETPKNNNKARFIPISGRLNPFVAPSVLITRNAAKRNCSPVARQCNQGYLTMAVPILQSLFRSLQPQSRAGRSGHLRKISPDRGVD